MLANSAATLARSSRLIFVSSCCCCLCIISRSNSPPFHRGKLLILHKARLVQFDLIEAVFLDELLQLTYGAGGSLSSDAPIGVQSACA